MTRKTFKIKSRLRDYEVSFVTNCSLSIKDQHNSGAFLVIDADLPNSEPIQKQFQKDRIIYIKAGEESKTLKGCTKLTEQLIDSKIKRNDTIYAVGGGVIEDIVAFVSMILYRGINWVFCPTTLLAQADSCIGSKSSINLGAYKNLLGSFYPPSKVLIDISFLKSLPKDQVRSGIGEILHFYLVAGEMKTAKRMMEQYNLFLSQPMKLEPYILKSLNIKKNVIERDEFDQGERNLFNYGHTFGHAIESLSRYKINHGQAVTMGMDIANYLSWRLGYINEEKYYKFREILKINLPRFVIRKAQISEYFKALSKDKKNVGSTLGCILTYGPGKMFKTTLSLNSDLKVKILSYFEVK